MSLEKKRKTADLLSICLKAGKAVKGFDSACEAVKNSTAACILAAADASAKTIKEAEFIGGKYNVPVLVSDMTKAEMGMLCGKETAVLAICDKGFSDAFAKLISH